MVQNVELAPGKYFTGVAGTVDIKFTDSKGNPIKGMPVVQRRHPLWSCAYVFDQWQISVNRDDSSRSGEFAIRDPTQIRAQAAGPPI